MVARAQEELEQELEEQGNQKEKYLDERSPPLPIGGLSSDDLQVEDPHSVSRRYAKSCMPK